MKLFDNLENIITDIMNSIIDETSVQILNEMKNAEKKVVEDLKQSRTLFEETINTIWYDAIEKLDLICNAAREIGDLFSKKSNSKNDNNLTENILLRLHARACLTTSEIIALLKTGHADGAHARWRTLHEVTVISYFLFKNDEETVEKYILHNNIESYKSAKIYNQNYLSLGLEPFDKKEFQELEKTYNELISRFGANYKCIIRCHRTLNPVLVERLA